jgi:RNA polymerase sigma factor (sigma-70 family)
MAVKSELHDRSAVEERFADVFSHLGLVAAYARRRGARDPDAIAAEAMTIAWRRLADVPVDDPRPWLIATARNLLLADRRRGGAANRNLDEVELPAPAGLPLAVCDIDPELEAALMMLSSRDREALLLVAWEDLTPVSAAECLGITPAAFRVRLYRARRRLKSHLERRCDLLATGAQPNVERL